MLAKLQKYSERVDVRYAKHAAFILLLILMAYNNLIYLIYGHDSCSWMLTAGRMESGHSWQAYGCMMHQYSKKQSQECMAYISFWGGRNHIVFVGDSRIRDLYMTFVNQISDEVVKSPEEKHQDIHYHNDVVNAKIDFYWRPFLGKDYTDLFKSWRRKSVTERPNLVITGSATWAIKYLNATEQALEAFMYNLTAVLPVFDRIKESTQILWMVQDPVIENRLKESRKMIKNSEIDKYNRAAVNILSGSSVILWSSSRLVSESYNDDSYDGLHMGPSAMQTDSQMIFNLYCNGHFNYKDGTCCSDTDPVKTSQKFTGFLLLLCVAISATWHIVRVCRRSNKALIDRREQDVSGGSSFMDCVTCLAKFGFIMGYFFLCDRTDFFMKENKHYSHASILLPALYILILGIYFSKVSPKFQNSSHGNGQFLHRDQSDEWKGWLQLIILLYHVTGASKVLPIYVMVRVFVSSYLFLSGYGHFSYFYTKGDYSLHRFCTVLFRMNFQVFMMCLVMNRPYQFYYFVPLVSYWFIVIYVTMAIWPRVTETSTSENVVYYFYFLLKIVILGAVITVFYKSEVLFERVFLAPVIKGLFMSSGHTVMEWRFRWTLDRYMTLSGMLFAFIIHAGRRHKLFDDTEVNTVTSKRSLSVSGLAVLGLMGHIVFTFNCGTKQICNEIHPYVSHIPIISFILLRNISGHVRIRYSYFFAWFGKISLELFISQYHIWLAGDTQGILLLVPGFPMINLLCTSFIFVCCAHELSQLTAKLTTILVPMATGPLVRNVSIFIALLLAIATARGLWGF